MDTPAPTLDDLRRRLDVIDDRIHATIMERASVIGRIAALKQSTGQPSFRPGRVAEILRRVMARHDGPFPRQSMLRIWCELLGSGVAMQGPFTVAVAAPGAGPGLQDVARDYFGSAAAMTLLPSGVAVLKAVADGGAAVGVAPMPSDAEATPWWPALAGARGDGPRIVARLPFADFGGGDAGKAALVIAAAAADATPDDRLMLVIETRPETGRARLIAALGETGLPFTYVAARHMAPPRCWHLVECDGSFPALAPRLDAVLRRCGEPAPAAWPVGSYARPLLLDAT